MDDVHVLGDRIARALDRITAGVAAQGRSDAAEASLFDALQDARAQNTALHAQLAARQTQLQALDGELQSLRAAMDQLRRMNTRLRAALAGDDDDPDLLHAALADDIAALHALRAADLAELDAIIAELKPLIAESADATG